MQLPIENMRDARLYYRPDTHDHAILSEIWREGYYSKNFPFNRQAVIVDIGAHNGYFSVFASRHTVKDSVIYAYEPVRENYDIMVENLALNDIKNVKAINMGISREGKPLDIYINSAHTGGHSIFRERVEKYDIDNIQKVQVLCIPFDKVAPVDTVDYCKIDIEGAEFEVLLGASDEALKKVTAYAVEFHEFGGYKVDDLLVMFKRLGYDVQYGYTPSKRGISFGFMSAIKTGLGA